MKNNNFLLLCILLICLSSQAVAGKLYKWVDKDGNISYSDRIPPQDSRLKRDILNEKGRIIGTKDAAKTPKQIEQLNEIKKLQKVQRRLLKNQLERDSALLKTFKNASDIDALANSKFEIISSNISIALGQEEASKKQILLHQQAAAKFEREAKQIPKKTINKLRAAQAQLSKTQQDIINFKLQEKDITKQLIYDRARLTSLQSLTTKDPSIHSDTTPHLLLGTLPCNVENCERLWKKARSFIAKNGSATIFSSNDLVLTKTPKLSRHRGLSLTKLHSEDKTAIILDIRCASSKGGKATCTNETTTLLIKKFERLVNF